VSKIKDIDSYYRKIQRRCFIAESRIFKLDAARG